MNWSDFFDRIFCVHYVEYKERGIHIEKELKRIGILDSGIFEFRNTYKNEFENHLAEKMNVPACSLIGPLFIETKRILAESLYKGYSRILIIQDDSIFLKNKELLWSIVQDLPIEANVIQFEKRTDCMKTRVEKWKELLTKSRINECYVRADGNIFWGGGCYALTRKGMSELDRIMTKDLINEDNCFAQIPNYAISIKSLCVQGEFADSMSKKCGYNYELQKADWFSHGLERTEYGNILV